MSPSEKLIDEKDHRKTYGAAAASHRPPHPGQISVQRINLNIPGDTATQVHVKDVHGEDAWRYRAVQFVHSKPVKIILACLLLLDVTILLVELYLLAEFPLCYIVVRDAISCCPNEERRRWLEEEAHADFCPAGEPNYNYETGCNPHKWQNVHTVEEVMFGLSMTILSTFMAELLVLMFALHPSIFFRQFFYALDFFIISVSLALEATFHAFEDDILQSLLGFLVLTRVWRFVRIGHGIAELTSQVAEEHYEALLTYTESLERLLVLNQIQIPPAIQSLHKHSSHGAAAQSDDHTKESHHLHPPDGASGQQQQE